MGDVSATLKMAIDCASAVAMGASVVMTVAPMLTPVVAPVMASTTVATSVTGVMEILGF
ncbi:hypothetical protein E6C27_scaffold437G00990 [Cucumis melo var. makuwa]|uniref:Uncharacterized protein n=1 Tax=Cucumis melo var. makuwa TaxID=1194695 RepID=A0A5A7UMM6_CUCMM|nr:hypothetical protein E6C27_scaffold437G00990 [Cucumis melo var. makuwa]